MSDRSRTSPPRLPLRYSVLLIFALACVVVLVSWATGADLGRALLFAALYFVVATAWAWWRSKQRDAGKKS